MSDNEKATTPEDKEYTYSTDFGNVTLTPKAIINHLCSGKYEPTKTDVMMFLAVCQYRKLNPFLKEAYLIKYSESKPASIVVGRGLHEKLAAKNPQFDGIESGVIIETTDGFDLRDGSFTMPGEKIIGGWATGYRKDWRMPKKVTVKYSEYKGSDTSTWGQLPGTMIEKVAIVQCLRSMFPEDLAGMYSVDEHRAIEGTDNLTVAEMQTNTKIPNIEAGRSKIEELIETYQYIVSPEAVESVRLDMEASKSVNDIREVYTSFKALCETVRREEDKITSFEGAKKAGAKLVKASDPKDDEGVNRAFDEAIGGEVKDMKKDAELF